MPDLLRALLEFENAYIHNQFITTYNVDCFSRNNYLHWFGEEFAANFIVFAHDYDSNYYGYWLYGDRTIENAPIVLLHHEGGGSVIANSLPDFLCMTAIGAFKYQYGGQDYGKVTYPIEESDNDWTQLYDELPNWYHYHHWLTSVACLALPSVQEARQMFSSAQQSHPKLEEWWDLDESDR